MSKSKKEQEKQNRIKSLLNRIRFVLHGLFMALRKHEFRAVIIFGYKDEFVFSRDVNAQEDDSSKLAVKHIETMYSDADAKEKKSIEVYVKDLNKQVNG